MRRLEWSKFPLRRPSKMKSSGPPLCLAFAFTVAALGLGGCGTAYYSEEAATPVYGGFGYTQPWYYSEPWYNAEDAYIQPPYWRDDREREEWQRRANEQRERERDEQTAGRRRDQDGRERQNDPSPDRRPPPDRREGPAAQRPPPEQPRREAPPPQRPQPAQGLGGRPYTPPVQQQRPGVGLGGRPYTPQPMPSIPNNPRPEPSRRAPESDKARSDRERKPEQH